MRWKHILMSQCKELFVSNLKDEFIKAIMISLKIDKNPFIYSTIDEFVSHITPTNYKEFMTELFGTQHAYLNGLDRIAKVAEQFKPQAKDSSLELKAKELIQWCESANSTVFDNATKSGRTFEDELKGTSFARLAMNDDEFRILNQVKPYCNYKQLIANIRSYQTSEEALKAFVRALIFTPTDAIQIANVTNKLLIKGREDEKN